MSLHSGKKSFLNNKFGKLTKSAGGVLEDSLYALGGAYDTFEQPYAHYMEDNTLGKAGKKLTSHDWKKQFESSAAAHEHVNTALTPRTGAMGFSTAYAPNKTAFTKGKSPIHGGDWYKKFDPSGHLVANTHTRHPAAAGH